MTLAQAKKLLPKWARGLADEVETVRDLRQSVREELTASQRGDNPLTDKQAAALRNFLVRTVQP